MFILMNTTDPYGLLSFNPSQQAKPRFAINGSVMVNDKGIIDDYARNQGLGLSDTAYRQALIATEAVMFYRPLKDIGLSAYDMQVKTSEEMGAPFGYFKGIITIESSKSLLAACGDEHPQSLIEAIRLALLAPNQCTQLNLNLLSLEIDPA
jgi:hypothetical protein